MLCWYRGSFDAINGNYTYQSMNKKLVLLEINHRVRIYAPLKPRYFRCDIICLIKTVMKSVLKTSAAIMACCAVAKVVFSPYIKRTSTKWMKTNLISLEMDCKVKIYTILKSREFRCEQIFWRKKVMKSAFNILVAIMTCFAATTVVLTP